MYDAAHRPESIDIGTDLSALVERIRNRLVPGRRLILGLVGAPGSGKSTIAEDLARELGDAIVVPMDGFHLASTILRNPEQTSRRGAIDTFDPGGYLSLLRRIRDRTENIVYAPQFDRSIEEPVAGAIAVSSAISVIITEGNYLLSDGQSWREIARLLDEAWFIEVDQVTRRDRLVARHLRFGKSKTEAIAFAEGSDEANAELVAASVERADLVVRLSQ